MKRKHERRLTQLLDRIEAEQAEMLDGLVQVDERSSRHHHRLNEMDARLRAIESRFAVWKSRA